MIEENPLLMSFIDSSKNILCREIKIIRSPRFKYSKV